MSNPTSSLRTAQRLDGVSEYYFSRKLREIASLQKSGVEVINLGIGNPDLLPPPAVAAAVLGDMTQPGSQGYQSYRGLARWRRALREWYASTYKVELSDENILPLAGSKEGIVHLSLAMLDPGSAVLYPNPGYPAYAAAARLAQADALPYPLPQSDTSPAEWIEHLSRIVEGRDARLLFVNSPHMPTGQVLERNFLTALVAFAKTRGIILVSDNAYSYYHPNGPQSMLSLPGAMDVCVELNSLSKSHHMPGWRLGVLAGSSDVLSAALQVKSNLDSGQWRPLQSAAAVALRAPKAWHAEQRAVIKDRRLFATSIFRSLGCTVPANQHGLFVWAAIPSEAGGSENFADRLLDRARVFIPPGTVFGDGGEGFVRLSLCSPKPVLEKASDQLVDAGLTHEPKLNHQ